MTERTTANVHFAPMAAFFATKALPAGSLEISSAIDAERASPLAFP